MGMVRSGCGNASSATVQVLSIVPLTNASILIPVFPRNAPKLASQVTKMAQVMQKPGKSRWLSQAYVIAHEVVTMYKIS